jgi:hypothetical protein
VLALRSGESPVPWVCIAAAYHLVGMTAGFCPACVLAEEWIQTAAT